MSGNRRRIAGAGALLALIAAVATFAHDEPNHVTVAPAHRVDVAGSLADGSAGLDTDRRTPHKRSGHVRSDRSERPQHSARRTTALERPTGKTTHGRPPPANQPRCRSPRSPPAARARRAVRDRGRRRRGDRAHAGGHRGPGGHQPRHGQSRARRRGAARHDRTPAWADRDPRRCVARRASETAARRGPILTAAARAEQPPGCVEF